jgi:hypothetical protein
MTQAGAGPICPLKARPSEIDDGASGGAAVESVVTKGLSASAPLRLKKLRVMVPERHDLALMKVVRGDRHDVDVIAEIHKEWKEELKTFPADVGWMKDLVVR